MAAKPPNKPRKTITPRQAAKPKSTVTPIGLVTTGAEVSHRGTQAINGGIEQEIRLRAYELFEQRGRKEGYDHEDWAQAEAEVLAKYRRDKSA
jgi:hypothetical protein